MQTPAFPSLQSKYKSFTHRMSSRTSAPGFFDLHPISEILRSVFFSSILWALIAASVYMLYTMIVGSR